MSLIFFFFGIVFSLAFITQLTYFIARISLDKVASFSSFLIWATAFCWTLFYWSVS